MKITVKLFATLSKGRFESRIFQFDEGIVVYDILRELKINSNEAAIVFVNGRHANFDQILSDGDTVSLFPPIGGG